MPPLVEKGRETESEKEMEKTKVVAVDTRTWVTPAEFHTFMNNKFKPMHQKCKEDVIKTAEAFVEKRLNEDGKLEYLIPAWQLEGQSIFSSPPTTAPHTHCQPPPKQIPNLLNG